MNHSDLFFCFVRQDISVEFLFSKKQFKDKCIKNIVLAMVYAPVLEDGWFNPLWQAGSGL